MNSKTVILTPAQLTQFSNSLDDSVKRLRSKGMQMRDSVKAAGAVWKDAKYVTFQKQLSDCMENLEKFNKTGTRYAEFLREKANLANKYLHRR